MAPLPPRGEFLVSRRLGQMKGRESVTARPAAAARLGGCGVHGGEEEEGEGQADPAERAV